MRKTQASSEYSIQVSSRGAGGQGDQSIGIVTKAQLLRCTSCTSCIPGQGLRFNWLRAQEIGGTANLDPLSRVTYLGDNEASPKAACDQTPSSWRW